MMFDLDDTQIALQESVLRCLDAELDNARLLGIANGKDGFDRDLWETLGSLGVYGVLVPQSYGGSGLGLLDLSVVAEAFGARAVPGPFLAHVLAALAISKGRTEKQRERWLPALVNGEQIGTLAFKKAGPHWPPEARAHISCPSTTPPPAINLQMSHVL